MSLVIGDLRVTDSGLVEAGEYKAGAVLGLGNGKLKLSSKKAADGSEKPYCVLLEDIKSDIDKNAPILLFGEVNKNSLSFGDGWKEEEIIVELRRIGIFAKGVVNG